MPLELLESGKIKDFFPCAEIVDLDLIVKELKYHQVCYQYFTRECLLSDPLSDSTDAKKPREYHWKYE